MILEKVICNISEIGTLINLHFDTNVAVLTEAFINVWTKFVLAVVIFYKMADTKVDKGQIQIIYVLIPKGLIFLTWLLRYENIGFRRPSSNMAANAFPGEI